MRKDLEEQMQEERRQMERLKRQMEEQELMEKKERERLKQQMQEKEGEKTESDNV